MRLLLDTHVLIWVFSQNPRLSQEAAEAIRDGDNVVFVSAATAWEITIKKALGKLKVPDNYREGLRRYRFTPLDITTEHALAVEHLPTYHKDPFDRMLIAQAHNEASPQQATGYQKVSSPCKSEICRPQVQAKQASGNLTPRD